MGEERAGRGEPWRWRVERAKRGEVVAAVRTERGERDQETNDVFGCYESAG
jgi:hypothetical protein